MNVSVKWLAIFVQFLALKVLRNVCTCAHPQKLKESVVQNSVVCEIFVQNPFRNRVACYEIQRICDHNRLERGFMLLIKQPPKTNEDCCIFLCSRQKINVQGLHRTGNCRSTVHTHTRKINMAPQCDPSSLHVGSQSSRAFWQWSATAEYHTVFHPFKSDISVPILSIKKGGRVLLMNEFADLMRAQYQTSIVMNSCSWRLSPREPQLGKPQGTAQCGSLRFSTHVVTPAK